METCISLIEDSLLDDSEVNIVAIQPCNYKLCKQARAGFLLLLPIEEVMSQIKSGKDRNLSIK
jgi:hypothetical protein